MPSCLRQYPSPSHSPAPAKEGWDGDANANDPGGQDHQQGMFGTEAEVAKGLTDDNVAFKGQEGERPASH